MKLSGPSKHHKLNELSGFVCLVGATFLLLSLCSFNPSDPSLNTVTQRGVVANIIGPFGSYTADILFQIFGLAAGLLPIVMFAMGWKWLRSRSIESAWIRSCGFVVLLTGLCAAFGMMPFLHPFSDALPPGGLSGLLLAQTLMGFFNPTGAALLVATLLFTSLYMVSSFSIATLPSWVNGPGEWWRRQRESWADWRQSREAKALEKRQLKEDRENEKARAKAEALEAKAAARLDAASSKADKRRPKEDHLSPHTVMREMTKLDGPSGKFWASTDTKSRDLPIPVVEIAEPIPSPPTSSPPPPPPIDSMEAEIPICVLEEPELTLLPGPPAPEVEPFGFTPVSVQTKVAPVKKVRSFKVPSTNLLNEVEARGGYDTEELHEVAGRIKSKLQEFNVLGTVVQINPGPVVTTFEYKPDAGIKYSRIVTLQEDLCMGLHAESIFIERLPGKPTVGIEVPNSRRETISLRQILESEEFRNSSSKLSICLGKDINGRIKVTGLESMPHLLIAGSTGSGKSVMLNTLIMSVLYNATPEEVRMILIDPKRVEMGIYEGIPHLLTPVITDPRQATNALRNAVAEMERRLKLMATLGVRNIEQYNRKVRSKMSEQQRLFEDQREESEKLEPLPFILIVIDELADLMILERANVEASVTRLAQMARAVGMHLVLATQRPSVDVITGLIKANFPSRISFRVATRVDSRTVLDVMGAEHLLGKGDMLYLGPGSSRLVRVHGPLVTESEINRVVDDWRNQARPDYDQSFLLAPPPEDGEGADGVEGGGPEDPLYQDAVRVVLEMGKASTSILQRRLRLGYGRAARILDVMHRDGIIGPPDGSRPREVLKRPNWLDEVESA
ncbi:MAG: DNA translocase FtsK [Candidatus Solibacter usitatus]|nr:DNA translocase FtsK [Candidatus Solibacter usitatus]